MSLTTEQQQCAVEVMNLYLSALKGEDGLTPVERSVILDNNRASLIEAELLPLLQSYLSGATSFEEFKSRNDGLNKRNEYWGFKGIKGQMFFNLLVNCASDVAECDQEVKAAIALPSSEDLAKSRIKNFVSYVRRVGEEFVEAGGSKHGRPKLGSIPFFISYFWQIQARDVWPVYYTNAVNTLVDLNLWSPSDDLAADYVSFKHLHEELVSLFNANGRKKFSLYDVEHVFWFKGGNPYEATQPNPKDPVEIKVVSNAEPPPIILVPNPIDRLPDSYVPPVISILQRLACNEPGLEALANASGISVPRAFEKNINIAFTMLGFETKLLGQGGGRVPDGIATDHDNSYAIIWDAKVRGGSYSMGTDDRAIREYIVTQSREMKRRRSLRNVYYALVSNKFSNDFDEEIRSIKMETEISEVCLIEASALVAIVEAKLRDPIHVTLGPDGIQRLFSSSGIISVEAVNQNLTG